MSTDSTTPAPAEEPSILDLLPPKDVQLYVERTNFSGLLIGAFLYGVHFALFFIAVQSYVAGKKLHQVQWGMVTFVTLLFSTASVYMGCNSKWGQQMWIDFREQEGGPFAFYLLQYNTPMIIVANVAFILTNFLADGLVLFRTFVVWNRNWLAIAGPIVVFLASTVMSIVSVIQLAKPEVQFFSDTGISFAIPYFSLSVALNIILTLMITVKLMMTRRQLRTVLGDAHAKMYTGIAAMLVESCALYSTFSILFIATFAQNNSVFNTFLPIQAQVMCISPLLIIIRVARGRAFSHGVMSKQASSTNMFSTHGQQSQTAPQVTTRTETFHMSSWPQKDTLVGGEQDESTLKYREV